MSIYNTISCHLEKIDNSKYLINEGNMLAIHSMQLQKEVKSNPKQPSCKKKFVAPRMLLWRLQNGLIVG